MNHLGPLPGVSELDAAMAQPQMRSLDFRRENIGRPVTFQDGILGNRTVRAELIELQKADLGRKYARKDRRPLDPPPVVQLRMYNVEIQNGQEVNVEFTNYDDMHGFGLLCHIDLFPVPSQDEHPDPASTPNKRRRKSHSRTRPASASTPSASTSASPTPTPSVASPSYSFAYPASSSSPPTYTVPPPPPPQHGGTNMASYSYPPPQPMGSSSAHGSGAQGTGGGITLPPISYISNQVYQGSGVQLAPMQMSDYRPGLTLPPLPPRPAHPPHPQYTYPPPPPPPHQSTSLHPPPQPTAEGKAVRAPLDAPEGVVAYLRGFPIKEDSKCTDAVAGACFAQSQSLEYHGRKVLMFVFSDIAVRTEGTFILRYRVFNIQARAAGQTDIPILAECYGGPFRIYSTKEFPGLQPSTDLTKHLSYFGVRLNLRETERKRRRRGDTATASATAGGGSTRGRRGGRRKAADEDDSDDASSGDDDD